MARLAHWAARKTTPRTIRGLPARQTPKDIWSAPHDTNVAPDTMAATQTTPRRKTLDPKTRENAYAKTREKASKTLCHENLKIIDQFGFFVRTWFWRAFLANLAMATREAENWSVSVDRQWTAVEYVFSTAVAPGLLCAHFKGRRPHRPYWNPHEKKV